MTTHCATASQGCTYKFGEKTVMAMETGIAVKVREIDTTQAYPLGSKELQVKASWLTPLPMRYRAWELP